jgi:radical SAM protein with 4Fe4S-binding SPASM domain
MAKKNDLIIGDPYLLQFNLLKKCKYSCDYCYLRDYKDVVLPFEQIKDFLKKFSFYTSTYNFELSISLTGGDIFLYPNLFKLIEHLCRLDYIKNISLLINSLWHKQAKDYILYIKDHKPLSVQINIDELRDREEDLAFLINQNIPTNVKILLSKNQKYYEQQTSLLLYLLKKYPQLLVSVDRLIPTKKEALPSVLSLDDIKKKVHHIFNISKENFITDDPIIKLILNSNIDVNQEDELTGCSIGIGSTTIFPDGKIKLCARIPNFETGYNIENFELKKYILYTKRLLQTARDQCKSCSLYKSCKGGCPATSYIINNKFTKDFHCVKRK